MQLVQKYQQLPEREQKLLLVAGIVLAVFLFFTLVWQPLNASIDSTSQKLATQQNFLQELSSKGNKILQLRQSGTGKQGFTGSLTQLANQLAGKYNITITRMQPKGEQLQVWVEQAAFSPLLEWLADMDKRGVLIIDADLAETGQPGTVKVRSLVLAK